MSQRAGGFGGLDIYQLYFRQERRAQLAVSASLDFLRAEEQQPQINNSEIPSLSVLDSNSAETNITLSPLYYSAETGAWQDQRQLDRLLRLLQDYPNLNLLIEALAMLNMKLVVAYFYLYNRPSNWLKNY